MPQQRSPHRLRSGSRSSPPPHRSVPLSSLPSAVTPAWYSPSPSPTPSPGGSADRLPGECIRGTRRALGGDQARSAGSHVVATSHPPAAYSINPRNRRGGIADVAPKQAPPEDRSEASFRKSEPHRVRVSSGERCCGMSAEMGPLDNGRLRARVLSGEATLGTFIGTASPVVAEVCAAAGFDWPTARPRTRLRWRGAGHSNGADRGRVWRSDTRPRRVRRSNTGGPRARRRRRRGDVPTARHRRAGLNGGAAPLYPPRGVRGVATYNLGGRFGLDPAPSIAPTTRS